MRLSFAPQLVLLVAWTISRCCLTSNHHRYNIIAQFLKQDFSCSHFFWGSVTDASLIGNQVLCYVCLKHQNLSGFSLISFMSLPTTIGVNIISSSKLKLTNTWKFEWSGARSESGPYLLWQLLGQLTWQLKWLIITAYHLTKSINLVWYQCPLQLTWVEGQSTTGTAIARHPSSASSPTQIITWPSSLNAWTREQFF